MRQLRALLRHRAGLVRLGTQQRNRIHAVVADFGYDRSGSYLSGPGRGWLAGLDLPATSREVVAGCLAVIDGLAPAIDRIDGELRARAKAGPRVKTLTTLPGAGQFTALVMVAGIGDHQPVPQRPQAGQLGRARSRALARRRMDACETTPPATHREPAHDPRQANRETTLPRSLRIFRRLPASSSFVLAAPRLAAIINLLIYSKL